MAIEAYTELLEKATADDNIVGFFLAGSRARGTQTKGIKNNYVSGEAVSIGAWNIPCSLG